jgi:hypothetical protein
MIFTQREFRGVNKLNAFSISDVYASDMINLTSTNYPALTTRPGYSVLGGVIGSKVLGLGVWKNMELHAVFNDGTWRKWDGSSWTTLASGLNTSAEWTFTNFKGNLSDVNLIGSNGVDPIKRYDGSTVQNLSGAPSGGKYITQFADRLWCAVGNELKASAYRMADDWNPPSDPADEDASGWYTVIETPDGEEINGIHAGLSKLTIFKPSSYHELYGYAPSDYEVRTVTFDVGVRNNKSAVTLNGVMHFLSKSIYQYAGGMLPVKGYSEVVQDYVNRVGQHSCLGTDGQNLYVSLQIGNTMTILQYDEMKRAWNVWRGIQAVHFAQMGNDLYIGDLEGRVLKLGGSTNNGNPIPWLWVSKPFTAPSMSQTVRWTRMFVTVDLPAGSTMNVYLSKTLEEDWELAGTITAQSDLQQHRIPITTRMAANAKFIRYKLEGTGPVTIYEVAWEQQELPLR